MRKMNSSVTLYAILVALMITGWSCNSQKEQQVVSKRAGINEVIILESADFDSMNPLTSTSANAGYVHNLLFMGMLDIDPDNFEYNPILAVSRPTIEEFITEENKKGLRITYEIRPEAVWDDGTPITGYDCAFYLKAVMNPKVDCEHLRGYYDFISDLVVDEENPKKFTVVCRDAYFLAEIWSSMTPLPEQVYDPEGIMRKFTVKEMCDPSNRDRLASDPDIIRFAEQFNSEKYAREKGYISGSGPYEFVSWSTGQRLIVKKKENWWGNQLAGKVKGFEANPEKIIYEIVTDPTTALTAMKDESGDVLDAIPSKDFIELQEDKRFTQLYNLHAPMQLAYSYIGMNMKIPKLSDKRVRQAMCHLVNREKIIDVLLYGLAEPVEGPIHPSKPYYNKNLKPYEFSIEKATKLLDEAGWVDSDGDGFRDKIIDGVKTPLKLTLTYPSGGQTAEKIALMFKEDARKAGVDIEPRSLEWTVFIDKNKAHDFEMFMGGWIQAPVLDDPKQLWHTESYNGGSNYVGFGNEYTDELIEKIRYELDEQKRNQLYLEFQEIVHEEAPYIFLWTSKNKLIIHKRFDNADPKIKRPGYVVQAFRLNPDFGKKEIASK